MLLTFSSTFAKYDGWSTAIVYKRQKPRIMLIQTLNTSGYEAVTRWQRRWRRNYRDDGNAWWWGGCIRTIVATEMGIGRSDTLISRKLFILDKQICIEVILVSQTTCWIIVWFISFESWVYQCFFFRDTATAATPPEKRDEFMLCEPDIRSAPSLAPCIKNMEIFYRTVSVTVKIPLRTV